jgi:hypothetical protein
MPYETLTTQSPAFPLKHAVPQDIGRKALAFKPPDNRDTTKLERSSPWLKNTT